MNSSRWTTAFFALTSLLPSGFCRAGDEVVPGSNPIVRDVFIADPAPLVAGERVYVYVGHDEAKDGEMFTMPEWLCYSTDDMKHWRSEGTVLKPTDFEWGEPNSAWASEVCEKDGRFYFYVTARGKGPATGGNNIGVAVADSPAGPFTPVAGPPLIRNSTTPNGRRPWEDIDPTVFLDDDGGAWIAWGNGDCYLARLKPNMVELDGEISNLTDQLPNYVEGPWLHKRGEMYYLTYALIDQGISGSEQIGYATAESIQGPYRYRGIITGPAKNSFTIHPGIIEFKGEWYFFYHNAALTIDGVGGALGRRAVCVERLEYNDNGSIKPISQTAVGLAAE